MDQEKAKAFLQKLGEDKEFQARMGQAKSPEEFLGIVQEYGFNFEMDEFKAFMQKVLLISKQKAGQELTDEELALVAGGADWEGDVPSMGQNFGFVTPYAGAAVAI